MSNKALWGKVCITNPAAVKPITGKQYQGNSPKPYWLIERATEEFGPVGIGWGVVVKSERFERLGEFDVLHVAVVSVWYVLDGIRSETFDQMGGTKAAYKTAKGILMVDEDAGKKSVTDGMVKCLSMIGFAGDIFSGRWDDSKYVAEARAHYAEKDDESLVPVLQASIAAVQTKKTGVMADVLKTLPPLTPELEQEIKELAWTVEQLFSNSGAAKTYEHVEAQQLDNDLKLHLWARLGSKVRTALKTEGEARKPQQKVTS